MIMSLWSAVSSYPTAGEPPKPVSTAAEQAPAARKQKKVKKAAQQQRQPSLSPEEEAQIAKVVKHVFQCIDTYHAVP